MPDWWSNPNEYQKTDWWRNQAANNWWDKDAKNGPAPNFAGRIDTDNATPTEGDGITLSWIDLSPSPGSYAFQWKKNAVVITGETSDTLTIDPISLSDAGDYTVDVTNVDIGQTKSFGPVTVIVAAGTGTPPEFTTQPTDQTVASGASASFTAEATGDPTPTYQWQTVTGG